MPPKVALLLTVGFIVWLFRRDIREKPNITGALWLPVIWMFLVASKPPSKWLAIFGLHGFAATAVEEGSSLDAFVFLGLIAVGIYILTKRHVSLFEFVRDNAWLTVFILYCLLAIFWADLPFVSFKRWIKILGHPIMVLIFLTEPEPGEALVRLMKRCAYVLFPVSILWIKYYPALGRKHTQWGGSTNCGLASGENGLGTMSAIFGLFLLWHLLLTWRTRPSKVRRDELRLIVGLLWLVGYCFVKGHNATAGICLVLGVVTMVLLGLEFVDKRIIGCYATVTVVLLLIGQLAFDFYGTIVRFSGHQATIEGRGRLWETLLATDTNPVFGTGFESYWLGERLEHIWSMPEFWWHPNEAHNGYLELYLNLGILGLVIFVGALFMTFWKIRGELLSDFEWGRFQMGCLVMIVAHNWTEASFKGLSFPFLIFFIIAVDYPHEKISPAGSPIATLDTAEKSALVSA